MRISNRRILTTTPPRKRCSPLTLETMTRTTETTLRHLLERVSNAGGFPPAGGHYVAGQHLLGRSGSGWTLAVICNEAGARHPLAECLSAPAMETFLRGMLAGISGHIFMAGE